VSADLQDSDKYKYRRSLTREDASAKAAMKTPRTAQTTWKSDVRGCDMFRRFGPARFLGTLSSALA